MVADDVMLKYLAFACNGHVATQVERTTFEKIRYLEAVNGALNGTMDDTCYGSGRRHTIDWGPGRSGRV